MSIAQFHRTLQTREQPDTLRKLRHISYEDLQRDDGGDQLSNWDPWSG